MAVLRGICKVTEYENAVFYKAHCDCMNDKHTQTLILDYDDNLDIITLAIHSTIWTHFNTNWCTTWTERLEQWYNSQCLKWSQVIKLIWTGQIEGENEFLFQSKEQVRDYITALEEGLEKLDRAKRDI